MNRFPDATAEDVTYIIGSGGMIDGLDEAVTGLKAGESAEFASTLVGGALEGEPADITVTVSKVSEQTLPEVDDEFASMISEFDSVQEMQADLTRGVEEYLSAEQVSAGRDKVLEALVEATEFEVPEGVIAAEVASRKEQINDQLSAPGSPSTATWSRLRRRRTPLGVLGRGREVNPARVEGAAHPRQGRRRCRGRRRAGRPLRTAGPQGCPERFDAPEQEAQH